MADRIIHLLTESSLALQAMSYQNERVGLLWSMPCALPLEDCGTNPVTFNCGVKQEGAECMSMSLAQLWIEETLHNIMYLFAREMRDFADPKS